MGVLGAVLVAAAGWASFAGTDVFLPSVGRAQGVANWYTAVWVHNPGTAPAIVQFYFLQRDQSNTGAQPVAVTVQGGDTVRYANAMAELFGREGFGAIRVRSDQKVLVTSRVFSRATTESDRDSKGQDFAGIPASFAIAAGQKAELLGGTQTQPTGSAELRYNYGFVETTGGDCTVRVTPLDATGAALANGLTYTVRGLEQKQYQLRSEFASLSSDNARLEVEVLSGTGRVIAFGSCITNGSQDPTTFEMSFRSELLAENAAGSGLTAVAHDASLAGEGTTASPLAVATGGVATAHLAGGAVTPSKLSATGSSPGQVLTSDGSAVAWQTPATGGAGLSAVAHDATLSGEGTPAHPLLLADSAVSTAKLAGNAVTQANLADGSVGSAKIVDGTIGPQDLADGAVTKGKLAASGGSTGQVLGTDGASLAWQTPTTGLSEVIHGPTLLGLGTTAMPLTVAVPLSLATDSSLPVVTLTNTGTGEGIFASTAGAMAVAGSSATNYGVAGFSESAAGVFGQSAAASGVHGVSSGSGNYGDVGTPNGGIYAYGANGPGVKGESPSGNGVVGWSSGGSSNGVYGEVSVSGSFGVSGRNTSTGNWGALGQASGVYGEGSDGDGVIGKSWHETGVRGESSSGIGVEGISSSLEGVYGQSDQATAVLGQSGNGHGVHGYSSSSWGIYGDSGASKAGYFNGDVQITGTLSKGAGSFKIDHPLDPENKYLCHSFVESPDMMNIYNGNVVTDGDGRAVVELPAYFEALNRDVRYQLTVIGRFAQAIVEQEIAGNRFTVRTNLGGVKVSWQVTGIRKDAFANAHRIPVEEKKPEVERGTYLHPDAFGQPEEKGVAWVDHSDVIRRTGERRAAETATQR